LLAFALGFVLVIFFLALRLPLEARVEEDALRVRYTLGRRTLPWAAVTGIREERSWVHGVPSLRLLTRRGSLSLTPLFTPFPALVGRIRERVAASARKEQA